MLEYTINSETYQFNAGFAFLREIEKAHTDAAGKDNGLLWTMAGVVDRDPERLRDALLAMNTGQTPRIDRETLEHWIEDHEDLESVFSDVESFFGNANCTKTAWNRLQLIVRVAKAAKE